MCAFFEFDILAAMNPKVSDLLNSATRWKEVMTLLRSILLDCGLEEEYKWRQPCYLHGGKNILLIGNFKNYCTLSFFKGVLLQDTNKMLEAPGENSQSVRMMKFTDLSQIESNRDTIKAYIYEAIEIEKSGLKVDTSQKKEQDIPAELEEQFIAKPHFRVAFDSLTPGRQRAYLMFFNQAKQSKTKVDRINKYEKRIMMGKGMNDCICGHSKRMPNCDGSHKHFE